MKQDSGNSRPEPCLLFSELAVLVRLGSLVRDGLHHVPVLGDLAVLHAPQVIVAGRSAAEGALGHRQHKVALCQHHMSFGVDHFDPLFGQCLQRRAQTVQTIGNTGVVLNIRAVIDVPDVNILVFLRATHSRRIFVQQLGRGLRIADDKDKVIVLDFVSDIRRMAEVISMSNEGKEKGQGSEQLFLKEGFVHFTNDKMESFVQAWINDVANLSETDDNSKLTFPEGL